MKYKINLLPPKEVPLKDRIVYFLLNYLRYIIVITQLVVIIVFFYRFQVDQKIIDLKEEISQKKEIIKTVKPLLFESELIEKKIISSNKIINEQNKFKEIFDYFLSFFPESITLTKLEFVGNNLKVTGTSYNISHLQAYINLLTKDKKFKKVDLQSLKKTFNGYDFILNLENYN